MKYIIKDDDLDTILKDVKSVKNNTDCTELDFAIYLLENVIEENANDFKKFKEGIKKHNNQRDRGIMRIIKELKRRLERNVDINSFNVSRKHLEQIINKIEKGTEKEKELRKALEAITEIYNNPKAGNLVALSAIGSIAELALDSR